MEIQKTLESQLEIILPTYNRKAHLEFTLSQLTAPESPVKNCKITVQDNASTDGTDEVIHHFATKFSNITHIRRPKNIGGNANIARAFETARAPYVWIVCDDDSFNWDAWPELQEALLSGEYDILLTRKDDLQGTNELAKIVRQLTFLPAGIYKTSNITSGVLVNMHANVVNLFPHLAVVCEVLNKKGTFFLPQGEIMAECSIGAVVDSDLFVPEQNTTYTPEVMRNMFWAVGFVNSLQMIEDPKLRAYVLEHVSRRNGFFSFIMGAFRRNYTMFHNNELNKAFIRQACTPWQRIKFDLACACLWLLTLFRKEK